jgi:hypothetical protein
VKLGLELWALFLPAKLLYHLNHTSSPWHSKEKPHVNGEDVDFFFFLNWEHFKFPEMMAVK